MKNKKILKKNKKRGTVILLTIVLSLTFVILTYGMMTIITKEIVIVSMGRESLKALAAADTGIECAVYWDFEHPVTNTTIFPNVDVSIFTPPHAPQDPASEEFCVGMPLDGAGQGGTLTLDNLRDRGSAGFIPWHLELDGTTATMSFAMTAWSVNNEPFNVNNPCVIVEVERTGYYMNITSTGYNTCNPNTQRRISRSVNISY